MDVNTFGRAARFSRPPLSKKILVSLMSLALWFASCPQDLSAHQNEQTQATSSSPPPHAQQTPEQLQQLVAPIALYPDALVAQILAASTFPEQVVEANRWLQAHPDLEGDALSQAVDSQPWDPSVKALVAFPSVLGNMDKNLAWTSSLGDAYYNQEEAVMDAVQAMRQRAQEAGNLKTTPQQTVTTEGSTIIIQPANPEVVYVPAYDPWVVYGDPVMAWPGWYPYPGIWFDGPFLSFGFGFGIGWSGGFGWGWGDWGCDWHHHYVTHDHGRYSSGSRTFYDRSSYYRGAGARGGGLKARNSGDRPANAGHGGVYNRPGAKTRPFGGDTGAARGYAAPRNQSGTRSGAFSGYDHGGQTRGFSSRGSTSFGGGGGFHGGGGGHR